MKFTKKEIDDIIEGVYSGEYTSRDLPYIYYEKFHKEFKGGVTKGYSFDDAIKENMFSNVESFSAAKTYQMVREMELSASLMGAKDEYLEAADNIFNRYTNAWGEAESNTILQSAMQADKWQEIEVDKDMFPLLKYSTIGDACVICRPLDGIVAKVNDPIWSKVYPPNHYNCLCLCLQLGDDESLTLKKTKDSLVGESIEKMSKVFLTNVGVSGEIFDKNHPYFDIPKKDEAFAKGGFGLI